MRVREQYKSLPKTKHNKKGPKRDRLLSYIWEMVIHHNGFKVFTERRIEQIRILYECAQCMLDECLNEIYRKWVRYRAAFNHATA